MNTKKIALHSFVALGLLAPCLAEEGGTGRYIPGNSATLIDLPPTKSGWIFETMFLNYRGDASAAGTFQDAGLVTADLSAESSALIMGGFYTFELPSLDAHYSIGAYAPYLWTDVQATVVAGGTPGFATDTADGLGDLTLLPLVMAWKSGPWQWSALLPIIAPTGDYQTGVLANVGRNYWTFDPSFQVSYNNEKTGLNASVVTGINFNTENNDTDYKSGSAFHIDASVQQLLPLGPGFVSLGVNAFYYDQFQGDSGSGAGLGDFEGRSVGIGPALGYILPVGENTFVAEARWLPEIDTDRRLQGDYVWCKLVYQF